MTFGLSQWNQKVNDEHSYAVVYLTLLYLLWETVIT
jgi:hypothetical protein